MKMKLTFKKLHPFQDVQSDIEQMSGDLAEHASDWGEWLVKQNASPNSDDINAVVEQLQRRTKGITTNVVTKYLRNSFSLGVAVAVAGENALVEAPKSLDKLHRVTQGALDFATQQSLLRVTNLDLSLLAPFRLSLLEGIKEGHSHQAIAQKWQDLADKRTSAYTRLARTELATALQAGINAETKRLNPGGENYVYIPKHPGACEYCKRLIQGRVFKLADIEGKTNIGRKQFEWVPCVPLHPNCVDMAIPASHWTYKQAVQALDGQPWPAAGVPIEWVAPRKRRAA